MGVLMEYAQRRLDEARVEFQRFRKGPMDYLKQEQPARKVVLLEWLKYARPTIGTKNEHKVAGGS